MSFQVNSILLKLAQEARVYITKMEQTEGLHPYSDILHKEDREDTDIIQEEMEGLEARNTTDPEVVTAVTVEDPRIVDLLQEKVRERAQDVHLITYYMQAEEHQEQLVVTYTREAKVVELNRAVDTLEDLTQNPIQVAEDLDLMQQMEPVLMEDLV